MGLLDGLLAANDGEGLLGLHLLAAAGPRATPASFGQRLFDGMMGYRADRHAQEDRQQRAQMQGLRTELLRAQIGDTQAQAQQRAAQAKKMQGLLDAIGAWSNPGGDLSAANAATVQQTGNLAPTAENARMQTQVLHRRQQQNPLFGIPQQAIQSDLAFNDGKGLADMIFKRGTPNMQVHNGVVIDLNRTTPGTTLPTISQDGKASQPIPDPTQPGGYRIIAPQGAAEVYGTYRQADERAKADTDLVKVFNPATGRDEYVTRTQVIERARPPLLPQPPAGGGRSGADWRVDPSVQASRDAERLRILQGELSRATDPADQAALRREIVRMWTTAGAGAAQAGPMPAGPSTREAALAQYDQGVQKDFADRRRSIFDAADQSQGRISNLQQLSQLLAQHDGGALSPTGLQLAKYGNSLGLKIDPQLGNKEAAVALGNQIALELRNPAGGAGMPGALSDGDRQFLASMVPGLATSAQGRGTMIRASMAVEQRKQEVAQAARNYEAKYGRIDNGFFDQLAAWSRANPLFGEQRQPAPGRGATGGW